MNTSEILSTIILIILVHEREGQSVPSELNKVHCAFEKISIPMTQKRMIAVQ